MIIHFDQIGILIQRQQCLDEERVVAVVSVEGNVCLVVIDFEVVVAGTTVEVHPERSTVRDLGHHIDHLPFDRDLLCRENRTDVELVVARIAVNVQSLRRVVTDKLVVSNTPVNGDFLDGRVIQDLEVRSIRQRSCLDRHQ